MQWHKNYSKLTRVYEPFYLNRKLKLLYLCNLVYLLINSTFCSANTEDVLRAFSMTMYERRQSHFNSPHFLLTLTCFECILSVLNRLFISWSWHLNQFYSNEMKIIYLSLKKVPEEIEVITIKISQIFPTFPFIWSIFINFR